MGLDYGMSVVEGSSSMEMELPHNRSGRSTGTCEEESDDEERVPSVSSASELIVQYVSVVVGGGGPNFTVKEVFGVHIS